MWIALIRRMLLAASLLAASPGSAHDIPGEMRVHTIMRAEGDRLHVLVRVPLALLLNLDLPKRGNGYLDLPRVQDELPRAIEATVKDFAFFEDGARLVPLRGEARISLPSDRSFQSFDEALASIRGARLPSATDVFWNQGYFDAAIDYPIRSAQSGFAVDFNIAPGLGDRLKLDLRYVTREGAVRAFELTTGGGKVLLDPRWYQAAWTFVLSGFDHILGGFDHLLFLVCLVAPFRRFNWYLVGVVTAFTVAHSITLIAAAYGLVPSGDWFPPLVETLIALSILYMAIENVLHPNLQWRWLVTGIFGLVHGFGFSFALANELQFAGSHLLLSLLAFNVGIEIGQLIVLALVWPGLLLLVNRRLIDERIVVAIISAFVAHAAWHWLTERSDALLKADWPIVGSQLLAGVATSVLLLVAAVLFARAFVRDGGPRVALPPGRDSADSSR
jgi:HupE / UreJ protein